MKKYLNLQTGLIILKSYILFLFYLSTIYRIMNIIAINFFLGIFVMFILNIFIAIIISSQKKILIATAIILTLITIIALTTPSPIIPYFN